MADLADVLRQTFENAVRAPYYRRAYGSAWKRVKTLDDLARLPLLDKATATRHQRDLVVGEAPAGFGVSSSGTTRLDSDIPPLNVLTCDEEHAAIAGDVGGDDGDAGRDAGVAEEGASSDDPYPGYTLVSIAVNHGLPVARPGRDEIFLPWMYDKNALAMLELVLGKPQPDGRRVTAARMSVGCLKVFTAWLLERGKDPAALGVRLIGTNSFRLSPFWRGLVEDKYQATLFDNFSLSEFATPATECKACGWLHFGWPPVLYEVLDLVSGDRVEKGVGRLVLTGLYPWVQKMPLLRYDTGDVVELGPRCQATGARGVRMLGRVRRGLVVDDGGRGVYALAPCHVQDVLEGRTEVELGVHPMTTLGILKTRDIGLPRWTVELLPASAPSSPPGRSRAAGPPRPTARLAFEVRFDPHIFAARAVALAAEVRAAVLVCDRQLAGLVRRKVVHFVVEAVRAGALKPPPDKHD